jgi:hypothetical protein
VLLAAADRNGRITTQKATDDAAEVYLSQRLAAFCTAQDAEKKKV